MTHMETVEGTLVSARIDSVDDGLSLALEDDECGGLVLRIVTAELDQPMSLDVRLEEARAKQLIHALQCWLVPYGGVPQSHDSGKDSGDGRS